MIQIEDTASGFKIRIQIRIHIQILHSDSGFRFKIQIQDSVSGFRLGKHTFAHITRRMLPKVQKNDP